MRKNELFALMTVALVLGVATPGRCTPAESDAATAPDQGQAKPKSDWEKDPSAWKVAIYPVYLWAPVMGANVNLENFPNVPAGTPGSGDVNSSFNGAGFAGFEIQKSGWSGNGEFLYASLSGDNDNPKVHLGMDIKYGQLMAGHTIGKGFSLEGGVRRLAFKTSVALGDRPEVSRNPGLWDPLVGMTWRYQAGKKWALRAHVDGGGFGVGSDVSIGAAFRADWRFAKHFGVTMGMGLLHFQVADSILDTTPYKKTLTISQTLYGPILGFGIYF